MKILLIAATSFEILPLINAFSKAPKNLLQEYSKVGNVELKFVVTGAGILNTTYQLTRELLKEKPDLAINLGIAGAFDHELKIGEVVHIISERVGDIGAETAEGSFLDMNELGLNSEDQTMKNPNAAQFEFLRAVRGLTVNKVHGATNSISSIKMKYPEVQVESMEGAAFFHVCINEQVNFIEIRSISNMIEPRNKDNWNIPLAIDNLNEMVGELINSLKVSGSN